MRLRGMNPVYKYAQYERSYDDSAQATYGGVVVKTSILLGIIAVVALYTNYTLASVGISSGMIMAVIFAPIVAIIAIIVTHRNPAIAVFSSVIYAFAEGIFIGIISSIFAYVYGGEIVQTALLGTFGVLAGMLFLYSTGTIRVGAFFRKLMFSLLMGLLFAGILMLIVSFFGVLYTQFYSWYVGIVVLSVIVSSLYLLIDFDNITKYVEAGVPKNMEWSLSLGLVVTIVWLYIELLRLAAILIDRR